MASHYGFKEMVPGTQLSIPAAQTFLERSEGSYRCMIKIFRGGRGGDTFKTSPPTNNFCLYPPPVLRCFWKDPLMTPPPTTPLQASFTATPLPIHHPFPPKNFDHTLERVSREMGMLNPRWCQANPQWVSATASK